MAPIKNKRLEQKNLNYMIGNFLLQCILNVFSDMFSQSKGTLPLMNDSLFANELMPILIVIDNLYPDR